MIFAKVLCQSEAKAEKPTRSKCTTAFDTFFPATIENGHIFTPVTLAENDIEQLNFACGRKVAAVGRKVHFSAR